MIHSLCIAFQTYSRIPVPQAEWTEKNMKYAMCFFPLVGAVIAGIEFLWRFLAGLLDCGNILYAAIACAIPLLITGGIHMDGFCDTVDALSSHQTRERKLEILKDSHTGAFAVIFTGVWLMVDFACFTGIDNYHSLWILGFGFVLSRALSGLAVVRFRNARGSGMLNTFSDAAQKHQVQITMLCWIAAAAAGMILLGGIRGLIAAAANGLIFGYYRYLSYRQFGGITGDLAGWFLQMAELGTALVLALSL